MEDTLWQGLTDMLVGLPMGITAENLAEKYNITREQCDEFAILSQQRWGAGTYTWGAEIENVFHVSLEFRKHK
jgi:acetyl-CoA acyltransferase 2